MNLYLNIIYLIYQLIMGIISSIMLLCTLPFIPFGLWVLYMHVHLVLFVSLFTLNTDCFLS